MFNLKIQLSALMIEFRHTRSQKTLREMANLMAMLENPNDVQIAREFILSNRFECR